MTARVPNVRFEGHNLLESKTCQLFNLYRSRCPSGNEQQLKVVTQLRVQTAYPVVISITSLPSRIGKIRPCLESLLAGKVVPDKILLPLPPISLREKCPYDIPGFLRDRDFCGSIVEIIETDRDWGPGTKMLGALGAIPRDCCLILCDDDVRYRSDFLAGIWNAQRLDDSSSFSYFTYRTEGLTIGQGCDGFSFLSRNLSTIKLFAEKYVDGTDLFFHDDLWISFYLASKMISIKSLAHLLGSGLIYEHEHRTNQLRHLSGNLARNELNVRGVRRLLREVEMPMAANLRIAATAAYDKINFILRVNQTRMRGHA